jgi:predicted Zn-dependent protease
MRWAVLPALAAALGLAACTQLRSLPGGRELEQYAKQEAQRTGQQVSGNLVRMVQSGEFSKSAAFDMEQEFWLGKSVAADVVARLGAPAAPPQSPQSRYLRDVGTVVAFSAAELRGPDHRPYPMKGYRFILVEASQVNATGCPGGFVAVTRGTLQAARSEDEVAAVLAHEIAHVQLGHAMSPVEAARQQEHLTAEALRGTSPAVTAFFGTVVTAGADFVLDKGYGKANELAADAFAARVLARAGYDPRALSAFLSRLTGPAAQGGFFQRHPPAAERVAALARLGLPPPAADPAVRLARFERALAPARPGH